MSIFQDELEQLQQIIKVFGTHFVNLGPPGAKQTTLLNKKQKHERINCSHSKYRVLIS